MTSIVGIALSECKGIEEIMGELQTPQITAEQCRRSWKDHIETLHKIFHVLSSH